MRFCKLRIAWSVFCGIACVLLIVLWVRSCWAEVGMGAHTSSRFIQTLSRQGRLIVSVGTEPAFGKLGWAYGASPIEGNIDNTIYGGNSFKTIKFVNANGIMVPHWFLASLSAALSVVPWLRYRFSLRTLLIATTLIAVVLGLAVYFASN